MFLSIAATLAMLVLGAVSKFLTRDWFHPATVFSVFWGCACAVAIMVAPENVTSGSGSLWILLNVAFVIAGGIAGSAFARRHSARKLKELNRADPRLDSQSHRTLRILTAACTVLGLLYLFLWLGSQGISFDQLGSLRGLGGAAIKMSVGRYSKTGVASTVYLQMLLSSAYLGPLLGGTLFVRRQRSSDTALAFVSLLPTLLAFCTQSTRSSVLYGIAMWTAGYMSTRPFYGFTVRHVSRRTIMLTIFAIPVCLLLIAVGDILRGGGAGTEDINRMLLTDRSKTYMCGHLAALSQWMDNTDLNEIQPAFGQFTFAGLYELLHPGTRVSGVIGDYVVIPTGSTNVYTYFRGLIEDVTLPGSLFVISILAFCGGFAYSRVLQSRACWVGILAAWYACIVFGITSLFNYNSMILAFVICGALWTGWLCPGHRGGRGVDSILCQAQSNL